MELSIFEKQLLGHTSYLLPLTFSLFPLTFSLFPLTFSLFPLTSYLIFAFFAAKNHRSLHLNCFF